MIWEKIKEQGFNIVSIGVLTSNLVIFLLIALKGVARVWEPTHWILFTEITICLLLISWGIERLIKDIINGRYK